jgi:hypothetical protein
MNSRRLTSRRLTLSAHGGLELIAGMTMMVAPAVLGFGAAGIVVSVVLGAILMGMGMTLQGGLGSATSWHSGFDTLFVLVTAIAALGLAVDSERSAAVFFVVLVAIQVALSFATRYVTAA